MRQKWRSEANMSENIRQTSEGESAGFSAGGLFENGKVKQHASEMEKRSEAAADQWSLLNVGKILTQDGE